MYIYICIFHTKTTHVPRTLESIRHAYALNGVVVFLCASLIVNIVQWACRIKYDVSLALSVHYSCVLERFTILTGLLVIIKRLILYIHFYFFKPNNIDRVDAVSLFKNSRIFVLKRSNT